jgi:hypothetical protein
LVFARAVFLDFVSISAIDNSIFVAVIVTVIMGEDQGLGYVWG